MKRDIKSFLLRIPSDLYKALKKRGINQEQSMNQVCVSVLRDSLAEDPNTHYSRKLLNAGNFADQLNLYIQNALIPAFSSALTGVILFGSAARNELRENSDIDLLIVLKDEIPFDRDLYSKLKSERIAGHLISPLLVQYPTEDGITRSVWLEAAIDGCILYDTDFVLARLLIKIRNEMAAGSVRRCFAYGVPYWIHNDRQSGEELQ